MNFFNILKTSFHKFCVLLLFKNYKNSIIRINSNNTIFIIVYSIEYTKNLKLWYRPIPSIKFPLFQLILFT